MNIQYDDDYLDNVHLSNEKMYEQEKHADEACEEYTRRHESELFGD